jgi:tetratricopeptide (TPR) repeat protein
MCRIHATVLCVLCVIACGADAAAQEKDEIWKRCRGSDPDARLSACTAIIESGNESPADLASAYYSRGAAYRLKSLFKLALDDFDAAITANPALIDAYGDRGIILTVLGRFVDAIADYSRVIEAYPKLAYAYYNRGLCYELIGLDDLAIEDISASIDIEPRAEFRYERRATIYFRRNQLDKALEDYEKAIEINPQYAAALYARGIIRMKNGDLSGGGADIALAKHHRATIAEEMERAGVK